MIKKYYAVHPQEALNIHQQTSFLAFFVKEMWILHKDIIEGFKVKSEIYYSLDETL